MEDKPISKFMVPFSGRSYLEAATAEEALIKVLEWRQFAVRCHHNKLEELNLQKIVIERIPEILEVYEEWLKNEALRKKFKKEWDYTTHRIAIGPNSEVDDEEIVSRTD